MGEHATMEVRCTDCGFTRVVAPDDDRVPPDVLVEHGEETGHSLTLTQLRG